MNRYSLRVPAADAELAMLRMLEWFPGGIEEQRDGDQVELSGFAEQAATSAPFTPDTQQVSSTRLVTRFFNQHIAFGAAVRG